MAEFTPIQTQEDFDNAIRSRLEREQKSIRAEFADYETLKQNAADYKAQIDVEKQKNAGYETEIAELKAKVQKYVTDTAKTAIALEFGLPAELANRLHGETDAELRTDAEKLQKIFGARKQPLYSHEKQQSEKTDKENALREMLSNMKK